jgi:hypothetical protein
MSHAVLSTAYLKETSVCAAIMLHVVDECGGFDIPTGFRGESGALVTREGVGE